MPHTTGKAHSHPPTQPELTGGKESLGMERLIFFSDAVFAIAITLLILDIRLPDGFGSLSDQELFTQLLAIWHKYLSYVVSFLVIGLFWVGHHRKFLMIRQYDRRLISLNLLLLMMVAFIPFPTVVLNVSGNRTATIFYALIILLAGLLQTGTWWYASRNHLLYAEVTSSRIRYETRRGLVIPAIFVLSMGVAYFNADIAKFFWLLIIPATMMTG